MNIAVVVIAVDLDGAGTCGANRAEDARAVLAAVLADRLPPLVEAELRKGVATNRGPFAQPDTLGQTPTIAGAPAASRAAPAHVLTPRELEVLRLIAADRRDREIASALAVSLRTVNAHVTSILNKLGVNSRTAAALCAVRHGLA